MSYILTKEILDEAYYRKNKHSWNKKNHFCPVALLVKKSFLHLRDDEISVGRNYNGLPYIKVIGSTFTEEFTPSYQCDDLVDRFDYELTIHPQRVESITTDDARFLEVMERMVTEP